jgi:hypothetical protein
MLRPCWWCRVRVLGWSCLWCPLNPPENRATRQSGGGGWERWIGADGGLGHPVIRGGARVEPSVESDEIK